MLHALEGDLRHCSNVCRARSRRTKGNVGIDARVIVGTAGSRLSYIPVLSLPEIQPNSGGVHTNSRDRCSGCYPRITDVGARFSLERFQKLDNRICAYRTVS